jgi:hypothetical protein
MGDIQVRFAGDPVAVERSGRDEVDVGAVAGGADDAEDACARGVGVVDRQVGERSGGELVAVEVVAFVGRAGSRSSGELGAAGEEDRAAVGGGIPVLGGLGGAAPGAGAETSTVDSPCRRS